MWKIIFNAVGAEHRVGFVIKMSKPIGYARVKERLVIKEEGAGQGRGAIPIDVSNLTLGTYHLLVRMANRYHRQSIFVGR